MATDTDTVFNEDEVKEEGMSIVEDDAVVDDDAIPVVEEAEVEGEFGLNGRPKDDEADPEGVNEDYADMEALLMDANGWEER